MRFAIIVALVCVAAVAFGDVKWSQPPDGLNSLHSQLSQPPGLNYFVQAADDFECLDGAPIVAVEWWGTYQFADPPPPAGYYFVIEFWTDNGVPTPDSHPLELIYTAECHNFIEDYDDNYEQWHYVQYLDTPFDQVEGNTYWISIYGVWDFLPSFHWCTGEGPTGQWEDCANYRQGPPLYNNPPSGITEFWQSTADIAQWGYYCYDMAFVLHGSPPPANVVCDPDPEYLTGAASTKTIAVKYLGGGSDALFSYSVKFSWDGSVVSTTTGDVSEGSLLSDLGGTFFYAADGIGDEIVVDCALLGNITGATGPGTLFTIDFTGLAVGTSDIDVTILYVRDQYNNPLSGFYEDDGLLIVDVSVPTITGVEIFNTTLTHTDDYIKDSDGARVEATVIDDDPTFSASNIVANLFGLGGGTAVIPGGYDAGTGLATWTIATPPGVTCNPANGDVWVYVDATDGMGNPAAQGSDKIISDNIAPTAVTNFDAAPGHQKCDLSWTMGTDLYPDGVVVQRNANAGDYPVYPLFKAAWPVVTPYYPGTHLLGTNVYTGAGSSTTDAVTDRNIYYYQAFCFDIARNYGAAEVTGASADLATNYWLGDVASTLGSGIGFYNGFVNDADINELGGWYHLAPGGAPYTEMDVGPTVHPAYGRLGLPTPDDFIEFEDLMIFAMNYGAVAPRVVPFLVEPGVGDLALALAENGRTDGGMLELSLRLEGNHGDVKGFTAELEFEGLEFLSARLSDEMSSPLADMFFWSNATSRSVQVDAAVLGTDVTIGGSGDVVLFSFQVLDESYAVDFTSAKLRGAANEDLTAELEGLNSEGVPVAFKLVQNSPNPFNPVTKVAYHVPSESRVTIRVFDVTGRLVTTLVDGVVEPGRHAAVWNGTNDGGESVGSGVYFCTMETPDYRDSHKMMLLK